MTKHFYRFSKFCQYFTKIRIVISDDYRSNIVYSILIGGIKIRLKISIFYGEKVVHLADF